MPVGIGPHFLTQLQRRAVNQPLGSYEALKGCEPMLIVIRAIVGLATIRGGLKLLT